MTTKRFWVQMGVIVLLLCSLIGSSLRSSGLVHALKMEMTAREELRTQVFTLQAALRYGNRVEFSKGILRITGDDERWTFIDTQEGKLSVDSGRYLPGFK